MIQITADKVIWPPRLLLPCCKAFVAVFLAERGRGEADDGLGATASISAASFFRKQYFAGGWKHCLLYWRYQTWYSAMRIMSAAVMLLAFSPLLAQSPPTVEPLPDISATIAEGETYTLTIVSEEIVEYLTEFGLSFRLDLSGSTAEAGTDFTVSSGGETLSAPYQVSYDPATRSVTATITAIDDSSEETEESISILVIWEWSHTFPDPFGGTDETISGTTDYVSADVAITDNDSSDAYLSGLSLSSGTLSPSFSSGTRSYTASVSSGVSSVTVTPTTRHGDATVAYLDGNGDALTDASGTSGFQAALGVGSNTIEVEVTAQNGSTTRSYTVVVTRAVSSDAYLSGLSLSSGTLSPSFSSGTRSYTASVSSGVSSVTVTPTTRHGDATVAYLDGNGDALTDASGTSGFQAALGVGSNTIEVEVTAQNGSTTRSYTVVVTRAVSSDAYLSGLSLSSGTLSPSFSSGTRSYTASVSSGVSSVTVTPTTRHGDATVAYLDGNGDALTDASGTSGFQAALGVGSNTIEVEVTAQNGSTTRSYTVVVTRAVSSDAYLSGLSLSSGTLSPSFSSGTRSYTASVSSGVSSVTVTPTTRHGDATVAYLDGNGDALTDASGTSGFQAALGVGSNTIEVEVTAQNGSTTRSYTVVVTRAVSSDAYLSGLSLSSGTLSPSFSSGTRSYTASVSSGVSSVTVTPTTRHGDATVAYLDGNGDALTDASGTSGFQAALGVGSNTIEVEVTAQNGSTTRSYTVVVTRAGSSDAYLSGLSLSSGTLSPSFSSGTRSYTASVSSGVSSVTVTPTTRHGDATVAYLDGNGDALTDASGTSGFQAALGVGSNTIEVEVTAQNGSTTRSYTVVVTRAGSSDAYLSGLSLSSGTLSPSFSSGTRSYTASVSSGVSSVTVTPTTRHGDATVAYLDGNGDALTDASGTSGFQAALGVGSNTIEVEVTAQNGSTTRSYTVVVTRAGSSDAYLSGLSLSSGTLSPSFSSGTRSYTASVSSGVSSVTVTPTTRHGDATVAYLDGNGDALTDASGTSGFQAALGVGSNTIEVEVTAQNGSTTRSYTVVVTRAVSSDAYLSGLSLSSGTLSPSFSSGTRSYTASVSSGVSSVTVTPTTRHGDATVAYLDGNGDALTDASGTSGFQAALGVGSNTIEVEVTAQNGSTTRSYTVVVTRAGSSDAYLSGLSLSSGTLSPSFSSGTRSYTASVSSGVSSVTVTPTTRHGDATVAYLDGNGDALTDASGTSGFQAALGVGSNTIEVEVTAQNGSTTRSYTVVVTRAGSSDAYLSGLSLSSGTLSPSFSSGTRSYTASVSSGVSSVTVTPTTRHGDATVAYLDGNGDALTDASGTSGFQAALGVGSNTIEVEVTAQNGSTTRSYTVVVTRRNVPLVQVEYLASNYEATEGGSSAVVTVTLRGNPQSSVVIPILASGSVGVTAADYTLSSATLTFSRGESMTFRVTAEDDDIDEGGERVFLSFGELPPNVREGSTAAELVELIDNDPSPTVTLSLLSDEISENGGSTAVTASLSHPSSASTTVAVTASAVSPATAGDFTLTGTSLTIGAEATTSTGTVTITAVNNDVDAPDKKITVSGNAENSQGVAGDPASLTLMIEDDDDPPVVSLSSSSATVDEDAGTVSLTVTVSPVSGKTVTVDYATADGTASSVSNSDYTSASGTLTFTAGQTLKNISVTITDDSLDEDNETFTLSLSNPENATLGSTDEATVTIEDDDAGPMWVVSADPLEIAEAGGTSVVTVSTGGVYTFEDPQEITLALSGTATVVDDYTIAADGQALSSPYALTLAAGATSVEATIEAENDAIFDPDETVTVTASHGSQAIGAPVTITIEDDEIPPTAVTLEVAPAAVGESAGETSLTVTGTLNGAALTHTTDVALTVSAGPDTESSDFTAAAGTLTIAAGETSGELAITLTPEPDTVVEGNETVVVGGTAGDLDVTSDEVTIEDDDVPAWVVSADPLEIAEAGGTSAMTSVVTVSTGGVVTFESDQTVRVAFSGTATEGDDYTVGVGDPALMSPYPLTLSAGATSTEVTVTAVDDALADPDETIEIAASHDSQAVGEPVTITVEDDETLPTAVTLEVAPASVGESAGATTVTVTGTLNGAALAEATVVTVTVSPDTALADDFAAVADFALTIDAGEIAGTATFSLTPADDFMDEEDEAVSVTGASSDLAVTGTSVIIEDNDVRGVTVTPTSFSMDEGDTVVDAYSVVLTSQPVAPGPGQPAEVTVTIEGHGGTDLVLDDDPARSPLTLTFTRLTWNMAQKVTVTAGEDDDYLDDEATLTHTPAGGGYDGVTADEVTVAVDDNDSNAYTAGFDPATLSVEEGEAGEVTLRIAATLEPAEMVRYRVATHNGTADWFQGDYPPVLPRLEEALAADFALQSDGSYLYERVFELRTLEDTEVEEDETFYFDIVRLADPSGGAYSTVIEGHEDGVEITITDDDLSSVVLTVSSAAVAEAAGPTSLTVTGTLDGAARSQDTAVALSVSPGPDTEAADFTATVGTLTILAGQTSGELAITLTPASDNLVEGAETVLVGGTSGDLIVTGASVTITDDDVPVWSVSVDPSSIGEAAGSAALTVSAGDVAYEDNQAIGLAYSGTATPTSDYTAPVSLALMAEDSSVEGTVAAVADTVADPDETVIITASHGGVDIGTATVTITEGICGRTGRVRRALVAAVQANDSGVAGCGDVTAAHLSAIAALDLSDRNLSMLSAGDFAGLSGLRTLNLKNAQLGVLPAGIFAGLSSLERLRLQGNNLDSLPMGVFDGLMALRDLQFDESGLTGLRADVFSGLSSLETIDLSENRLVELPAGVFSGLSSLADLNLKDNDLLSLPDGLFAGLNGLSRLRLDGNGSDPLPIAVSLEKVGADQFKAVVPAGAPFGFDLAVTVSSGGEITGGTVAMAAGSVASAPLQVTRVAGTVDAVTADMGVLPGLPSGHRGYVLERDAALPLEVLPRVLSTDAALSALALSNGTLDPAFASATTSYTASVAHTVSSVTVTAQTSDASATVGYYDAGDAAIEDADGNTAGHQVALAVGENTVKVKVTAEDGASSETYTMVITRADETRVSIAAAATPVNEGSPAEFTLTRTGPSDLALTVLVQVSQAGEVLADAAQYTSAAEVTFALGESAHTLSVATENDKVDEALSGEPAVAGRITAALQAGAGYAVVSDRSSAEIAVEDDDAPDWSVAVSPAEIGEAGGRSILTVSTGGMVTFAEDQTLSLTTSGTATAGDDYTLAGSLTLTAGLTSATAEFAAISDGVAETSETADIAVSHGGVLVGTATVTISDGICGRTRKVRNALVTAVQANDSGVTGCGDVTALHLSGLSETLDLAKMTIRELKADDFAGLSALEALDLKKIKLNSLPAGIFDDLTALATLRLQQNALSDLPAGLFAGLTELTNLQLDGNQLAGLEAGEFAGLSKLETLDLEGNQLSTIQTGAFDGLTALTVLRLQNNQLADMPAGLFDDLTQLTELNLRGNQLQSLPDGVFAGLAAVTTLKIDGNPTDPMPLTVGLEKVGEDQFKAVVPAGAPFAIELPVSVSSGGAIAGSAASVTIAAGAVESAVLSVTRTAGTTDAVTVNIGVLPDDQPATHVGYALRKSADLPLGVLAAAPALPTLSVADPAAVQEGDTTITFTVTLTGTVTGTVTVDYATEDGTALARDASNPNGDYRAAADTLMFSDEQRTQPVEVTIYLDAVDEQQETFKLKLSNPTGATLTADEAIGTITNSGPLPRAWLVRFGRTVAGHVTEGIGERLMQAERADAQVTFAGVRLPFGEEAPSANAESHAWDDPGSGLWDPQARLGRAPYGNAAPAGWRDAPVGSARELTSRDLLLGSSFVVRLGGEGGADARTGWTVWGRGMATRFDGSEDDLKLDGEVATYLLGADTVRGRWLGGIALAHSRGDGGYDASLGASERGELASTLTSVHPYVRFTLSERITAWGALGYGRGGLMLDRGAAGTWDTDTAMQMATAGARGVLKSAALTGGFELAVRSDALYTRMTSGASENAAGRLAASEGSASRLRLILEGARTLTLGHRTLTPNLELGLRHDAGDAETGTGIEVGGGLRYADPTLGLSLEVKARSLIAHQDSDYREWGASAAIRLNPGATGRGLMLTLEPSWGMAASGVERLWGQRGAQGQAGYGGFASPGRLNAEVGYVLDGPMGVGIQTPYAALSLGDTGGRTLRVGWRLARGSLGNLDIEGTRRQVANRQSAEHGILLRAALRW